MSAKERIKKVRQTLGLTQGKFAERIALSTSYLSEIEQGKNPVNDRIIRLIGMEYKVSEHWLHTGEGSMYNNEEEIAEAKANNLFKSLNPQHRECALAQLSALVDLQNADK